MGERLLPSFDSVKIIPFWYRPLESLIIVGLCVNVVRYSHNGTLTTITLIYSDTLLDQMTKTVNGSEKCF